MAIFFLADPAALANEAGEPIDLAPLQKRYWAFCEDCAGGAVQERFYRLANRFELGLLGGPQSAPFLNAYAYGAAIGFHFSEFLSLHALGWKTTSRTTDSVDAAALAKVSISRPDYYFGGEVRGTFFYGKFTLFGIAIPRYQLYLSAGGGALRTGTGLHPTWTAGIGQQIHLSPRLALNIDVKMLGYRETTGDASVQNGLVTAGLSFLLDPISTDGQACQIVREDSVTTAAEPAIAERSLVQSTAGLQATSDQITDQWWQISYRNHRRDAFWEYPSEAKRGWDYGALAEIHRGEDSAARYSAVKGEILAGAKISPALQATVQAGGHQLENLSSGVTKSIPVGEVSVAASPTSAFHIEAGASHDFVYQDMVQPGGVTNALTADSGTLNLHYWPELPLRFTVRSALRYLSDGNGRRDVDLGAMYGLSPGEPWVWIGLGMEYLSFTEHHSDYWSPSRFLGVGPRFEAEANLWKDFSGALSLNLAANQEDQSSWAFGYYGAARLRYGGRERFHVDLNYVRIQSIREGSTWFSNSVFVSIGSSF